MASAAMFLAGCLAVIGLYWQSDALNNQYDDAYITYRYAVNLAQGHGLVFNQGERMDSASSLSYVLFLAGAHRLGLHDLETVASVIGICAAGGIAAVVFLAVLRQTRRSYLAVMLAMLTVTHGFISAWAVSGMETVPYAFLVSLFVYREVFDRKRDLVSVALLGLIAITRFEGVIVVAVWAGGIVIESVSRRRWPERRLLWAFAALLMLGALLAAIKFRYYGTVIPHSLQLKEIWLAYQPEPEKLIGSWRSAALGVTLLAVGGLGMLPDGRSRFMAGAYLTASAVSLLMGPNAGAARYSVHLLPTAFMLAAAPLSMLFERIRLLGWAFVVLLAWETHGSEGFAREQVVRYAGHQRCRKELGRRLQETRPPGRVVSSDIGAIAYVAPGVEFLDAVGLTSLDVLQAYLHNGSLDAAIERQQPVLVLDTVTRTKGERADYKALTILRSPNRFLVSGRDVVSTWRLDEIERLDTCTAPDGLAIAWGRLGVDHGARKAGRGAR